MNRSLKGPQLEELMSHSHIKMPFSNFEDEVIQQIIKQEEYESSLKRDIRLSWVSFITGIILGIVLTVQVLQVRIELFGLDQNNIELISYFIFSLFVIFSLDLLIQFSRKIGLKELFSFKFPKMLLPK